MTYNPNIHHRRSIRLPGYDYAQAGAYFITICTDQRQCLFGEIRDGKMHLNEMGVIVRDEWEKSSEIRGEIELREFVVMPNHFHGIVIIQRSRVIRPDAHTTANITAKQWGPAPQSIGALVAGFKSIVTKRINQIRITPGLPVWQRNY